jgi:hypothetical protein
LHDNISGGENIMNCDGCKFLTRVTTNKRWGWTEDRCIKFDKICKHCDCHYDERCTCGPQSIEIDCGEESELHLKNRLSYEKSVKIIELKENIEFIEKQLKILNYVENSPNLINQVIINSTFQQKNIYTFAQKRMEEEIKELEEELND